MSRHAVFVTVPPLLSEFIAEVARDEAGFIVVAEISEREALGERLSALVPDFVLVMLYPEECDDIGTRVIELVPTASVLVLNHNIRQAFLHQTGSRRILTDFSLAGLIALFRDLHPSVHI